MKNAQIIKQIFLIVLAVNLSSCAAKGRFKKKINASNYEVGMQCTTTVIEQDWNQEVALVNCGITYTQDPNELLELKFAKLGPTRLSLEQEKVTDIFVYPQNVAEVVIHPLGCLMVLPQIGAEKVYITIFGENDTIQDVVINFTEKRPTPVKLVKEKLVNF